MNKKLKVLQVSPTYFSSDSVMGGGERFVLELSKAMSAFAEVKILSFGRSSRCFSEDDVTIKVIKPLFFIKDNLLNPFHINLYREFKQADVIHVHQLYTFLTEMSIIWARILGKPIFITDHGGGGRTFLTRFGIARLASGLLPVSEYSSDKLAALNTNRQAIYGGVDQTQYYPYKHIQKIPFKIISVGRILPHKGFHLLIKALGAEELVIVGHPSDQLYFDKLIKLAQKKNVKFLNNIGDDELKEIIASASLAIFPSTNIGLDGELLNGEPELLGIAPLETMAMNIPTIVSNIGAYPEICYDKNKFLFLHDQLNDLEEKIKNFWFESGAASYNFDEHIKSKFTWKKAAIKCLEFYKKYGGKV